ncbi:MAG: ATP-binding protein [Elusimicrobiota bacterium]
MPDPTSKTPFEISCLDVLKAIGKALSQMGLYSASHPAVQKLIGETAQMLSEIIAETPSGEIVFSVDNEKLLANGHIVGLLDQVPNSVPQIFSRFRLNSIAFRTGVTDAELGALCQMASLRPEAVKDVSPEQFLAENSVTHIMLNEAVYTKVEKATDTPPPIESGAPERAAPTEDLLKEIEEKPIEDSIAKLVRTAAKDPRDQAMLLHAVMRRVRDDLEQKVAEATKELRHQKQTLENEQTRTKAVVENMAQGVVVVDEAGKVLTMNPEAEELFGTRLVEMAGKFLRDGAKEEHLVSLAKEIQAPGHREISKDIDTIANDDTRRTLRGSTVVIHNEAGKPVGMVSALSDKAKHRELGRMEREFVAHVTHELRAPLASIRAALEIVEGMISGKMEDEAYRMFQNALRNTDRLNTLITGILDFSKIESGQMSVEPKPCQADKIAEEAVESMQPWAKKKGLRLETSAQPGLETVEADLPRSVQVLINLLSNAIKFTPKGGSIGVSVRPGGESAKRFVQFAVEDTGPGIPEEEQPKVFEKFVQIAAGEKHVGGTGLGLAIAKALIHMQKGQMWLESEPGKGAKFFFTLPYYVPPPEEARARRPKPKPAPWWKKLFGLK